MCLSQDRILDWEYQPPSLPVSQSPCLPVPRSNTTYLVNRATAELSAIDLRVPLIMGHAC
jgi:hypothetical protein